MTDVVVVIVTVVVRVDVVIAVSGDSGCVRDEVHVIVLVMAL